jgi:hypothetical protein
VDKTHILAHVDKTHILAHVDKTHILAHVDKTHILAHSDKTHILAHVRMTQTHCSTGFYVGKNVWGSLPSAGGNINSFSLQNLQYWNPPWNSRD